MLIHIYYYSTKLNNNIATYSLISIGILKVSQ